MKRKRLFYDTRLLWGHQPYFTMKGWLKFKDSILNVKKYKNAIVVRYGIKLQPKRRHKRSIKARDYGRLFNCTKFYYDPFLSEEESIDYFEERERLREIEGYKE